MRLRITLAFVAVLALALFLAGSVSLELVRKAAATSAQSTVLHQADALATSTHGSSAADFEAVLPLIRSVAGITEASIVVVTERAGHRVTWSAIPSISNVSFVASDASALASGRSISGISHHIAFAAAPLVSVPATGNTGAQTIAIALESPVAPSGDELAYFVLAGGISLLVAAALAAIVARRIARQVGAASAAAGRIAAGELDTRVALSREFPELERLSRSLNTMAENLERSRHLERQFLLSISHDLRTPLTSIRGYAEAITENVSADVPGAAAVIVHESTRLERLIGDLLDLARIDARAFSLHREPIDPAATVIATAEGLRYEFAAAGVELEIVVPTTKSMLVGDADRLGQIVANLVENALKYARTRVRVELVAHEGEFEVIVDDDGPGIANADLPHVFERLFSSARHPARAAGTGLGLAIVAELAHAMGGDVAVESPTGPSGGTKVSLRLPESGPSRGRS